MRKKYFCYPKIYYGIDAPRAAWGLIVGGILSLIICLTPLFKSYLPTFWGGLIFGPLSFFISGITMFVTGICLIISSLYGKYRQRDVLLNQYQWQGSERVLDVGCGRGLLLIGAAKRLTTGKAYGVDIWQQKDLSANSKQAVLYNALCEGVEKRVEVYDADARDLPFPDNFFDVIVSSLVLHNIAQPGRNKALKEIVRVLKPEGTILLQDIAFTQEYREELMNLGIHHVVVSNLYWFIFPPVRIVSNKPVDEQ